MKSTLKKLAKIRATIEEKIQDREFVYDDRSEKWQDSDKGCAYEEKTTELQDVLDNLEMTIESLEAYIEI